jgi:hypothetical protein
MTLNLKERYAAYKKKYNNMDGMQQNKRLAGVISAGVIVYAGLCLLMPSLLWLLVPAAIYGIILAFVAMIRM